MENNRNQQNKEMGKSNAERDQDEGNMNNGTIGGDIGIGSNNDEKQPDHAEKMESAATDDSPSHPKENAAGKE